MFDYTYIVKYQLVTKTSQSYSLFNSPGKNEPQLNLLHNNAPIIFLNLFKWL